MSQRTTRSRELRPHIVLFGDFQARGGTERRFANSILVWHALGYRVQIVGHRTAVPFYADEIPDAGFVHLGTRRKAATAFALWRHIRGSRPHAVISTGHISNTILARVRRFPSTGARFLLNVPNDFVASEKDVTGRKKARKLREIERLYPAADGIIAGSRGVTDNLARHARLDGIPMHVVYNGSITQAILARAEEPVDHDWLAGDRQVPVILGVGRLARQKDFPTLLRAFAAIRQTMAVRLIIAGEGPERAPLEELAASLGIGDHVSMPGYVENPYAWMRRADLFALSSAWEGFPNVLAEALGLGTRVVATDCPSGPREILDGGRLGQLVPVGDHAALANAAIATLQQDGIGYDPAEIRRPFTDAHAARRYLEVCGLDGCATAAHET